MRTFTSLALAVMTAALAGRPVSAEAQAPSGPFFGIDVFAGGVPRQKPDEDAEAPPEFPSMGGWELGASVRFLDKARWLSVDRRDSDRKKITVSVGWGR